jgi:flavin-dependent dehydrogenase
MKNLRVDVCVIGGGPAGATLAHRLLQLGHSVAVIQKRQLPGAHAAESLTPGALPLLDILGIRDSIENAGFARAERKLLIWATHHCEHVEVSDATYQIDRPRFDNLLLEAARLRGAIVLQPSNIVDLQQIGGGWKIDVRLPNSLAGISARLLADASGRNSITGGTKVRVSPPTLAITGQWLESTSCYRETRIEAGDDAWYWGLTTPSGSFSVTAFIDAASYAPRVTKAGSRLNFYLELLARSRLFRDCLQGELARQPQIQDATCYIDSEPATARTIRVGDAAFTIDPLSSQGLVTAIGTALHAATVLHTMFLRPTDTDIALAFYGNRVRSSSRFQSLASAQFYQRAAAVRRSEFWIRRARSDTPLDRSAAGPALTDVVELAPGVLTGRVPIVSGDFVTTAPGVFAPRYEKG